MARTRSMSAGGTFGSTGIRPGMYRLLTGYVILSAGACDATALLEICRRHSLVYGEMKVDVCGAVMLCCTRGMARSMLRYCEAAGVCLQVVAVGGLPTWVGRFLRRPGLVLGSILGVWLFLLASGVVWDIRVTGTETLSPRAVEETLAACGFSVGTSLRGFRADVTENEALLHDDRLAWISINRRGTVAYVEVREAKPRPAVANDAPADVVASIGGVIDRVELEAGNVRVMAGQAVAAGDVLVSGLWDSEVLGIRATHARARVYARTVRELTVQIPLSYEQKVYVTGEESTLSEICQEKWINFFGKSVKFSKKTGNAGVFCDTIEGEQTFSPIAGVGLPLSVRTVWYLPYTTETVTRTYAEAEELAYLELSRLIGALPGGAEVLSKTVTVVRGESFLLLRCALVCCEDIATERAIEIGN